MKVVLVTGGCGFIGSNFLNYMLSAYPHIRFINVDCLNYCADVRNVTASKDAPNYKFIKGDITSFDLMSYILQEEAVDVIVHFAAQSHVDTSFTDSFQYTHDNIVGTHTLLEAARLYGKLTKFIHVSTDEVYGENEPSGELSAIKSETTMLLPTNPYAATKAAAEMLVCSYYKSFKLPVVITRGNNTYGPHQYPEKLIPKFIDLMLTNTRCTIHGAGDALRNFLYIDDVVRAFEIILLYGNIGEIYNIGGDMPTEKTVMDITTTLCLLIKGRPLNLEADIEFVQDRAFNDTRYWISNKKLKALGWSPHVDLHEGLTKTIAWRKRVPSTL